MIFGTHIPLWSQLQYAEAMNPTLVLVELGYLTNANDESLMATGRWRAGVAKALTEAIDKHFAPVSAPPARQAANR